MTAGLDDAEASRRLAKHGPNRLPTARKRSPLMRFLLQFNNILVYVLLAAGFIKLMMGLWIAERRFRIESSDFSALPS